MRLEIDADEMESVVEQETSIIDFDKDHPELCTPRKLLAMLTEPKTRDRPH